MFRRKKSSGRQAATPGVTAALLQQSKAEAAQHSKAAAAPASKEGSRPQAPRVFHGPRPQQPPQNRAQVQFDVTVAQSSPMPSFAAAGATVQVNTGAASAPSSPIEPTSPHQQLPLRQGGSHGEATAATARRPYFPGGFTGRRTVISNGGSLVSSCGAQSVGTDGQTLVGEHGFLARPLSHSSESATSTFISANKNVFTVGHTLEQYVNQGPEDDDWLHDVQLRKSRRHGWQYDVDRRTWRTWWCCSCRGCGEYRLSRDVARKKMSAADKSDSIAVNVMVLSFLALSILCLFVGYPLLTYFLDLKAAKYRGAFGLGGTNATGQVPYFGQFIRDGLIDRDTPKEAYTRMNMAGTRQMNLVFSDEFNVDGRSFGSGEDPYFEALDQWYWETGDYEWYDPAAVTTKNGSLVITLSEHISHNKLFRSGVIATWNKFCFRGGLLVANVVLPGDPHVAGFWPAIWTMGNLGRAGYGATTHGMWPYTYDSCDIGTLINQTHPKSQGGGPEATLTSGEGGRSLSFLPGQRLSSCTCPGEDHPGPVLSDGSFPGRSSPELDVRCCHDHHGYLSMLMQLSSSPHAHVHLQMFEAGTGKGGP
ncbi:unnamed protein product [Jaminaea pallidilutea]